MNYPLIGTILILTLLWGAVLHSFWLIYKSKRVDVREWISINDIVGHNIELISFWTPRLESIKSIINDIGDEASSVWR